MDLFFVVVVVNSPLLSVTVNTTVRPNCLEKKDFCAVVVIEKETRFASKPIRFVRERGNQSKHKCDSPVGFEKLHVYLEIQGRARSCLKIAD